MEASFRSFEEIVSERLALFDILEGDYWAHIDGCDHSVESLKEHCTLVSDYFLKVVKAHELESIITNQITKLTDLLSLDDPKEVRLQLVEVFISTVIYHDLGKVNSNFQREKMNNPAFSRKTLSFGSQHSSLGAFLFCSLYIEKLLKAKLSEKDVNILLYIILCFANPIYKHHSSYLDIKKELASLPVSEFADFLSAYNICIDKSVISNVFRDDALKELRKLFNQNASQKAHFILYSLLKLNFSLLTASDYYATGEFMSGPTVTDFGLLNEKLRFEIDNNFRTALSYNRDLFNKFNEYKSLSFNGLQERTGENLNFLRQKLNAEVISEIRKSPSSHWYYIEAPTGAGKTNLSLACINELLAVDKGLNKVFYVFPFTTLITQTFSGVKEAIKVTNADVVQLHSRAGFHRKEEREDGTYGDEKLNFIDNLFTNYPITITSHVKFFEIVKGNSKESNYLFHRLCNSIVVLDEIQSYNPQHWDKLVYFLEQIAPPFNMRFIIMSATLPKIDLLSKSLNGKVTSLTPNRNRYFSNPNFAQRARFNFSLLNDKAPSKSEKESYLESLATTIHEKSEQYENISGRGSGVLIEFITKNSASLFNKVVKRSSCFMDYTIYLLSGDILEPRRRNIISQIRNRTDNKVLLISTQVVEAGVNIDMDLGFKNHAIIDSDEQFAGRINRNATKQHNEIYLFRCDSAKTIYGKDERYKQQQTKADIFDNIEEILENKSFHSLYEKVFAEKLKIDPNDADKLESYVRNFEELELQEISRQFRLIEDNETQQIFIPLDIPLEYFDDPGYLKEIEVISDNMVRGELVFEFYKAILKREIDYIPKSIEIKKLGGILSDFTINAYPTVIKKLAGYFDEGENGQYGFKYLLHCKECYTLEDGFDFSSESQDIFL
ncbi:CRISPR-associated helicase Cas3 [Fulvivirga imtechensis AK7]|uniref:CRISPR-associated helicase Cas3 n=1 Tax=Fulvivirga imtechensis AK7 TaxID=1237149 RepID=L8JVA4_9BACT|nr:CRISPR-associated helicase/endonuclease Cas3 [Fulvivirga imtechensis]ELR72966.1 CRISPR-associated helicase Cas3 [Fulvivirga imtechensis AK7]